MHSFSESDTNLMLKLADYTRLRDGTTLEVAMVNWPEPHRPVTFLVY